MKKILCLMATIILFVAMSCKKDQAKPIATAKSSESESLISEEEGIVFMDIAAQNDTKYGAYHAIFSSETVILTDTVLPSSITLYVPDNQSIASDSRTILVFDKDTSLATNLTRSWDETGQYLTLVANNKIKVPAGKRTLSVLSKINTEPGYEFSTILVEAKFVNKNRFWVPVTGIPIEWSVVVQ